jgi:hypothetical protein
MALLEVTVEQILTLIQQLPVEERWAVLSVLSQDLQFDCEPLDEESQAWLEADLVSDGDEYDWQEAGISMGKPVRCVPGKGVVVVGVDGIGT